MATVFQKVCSEVCKLEGRKSVSRVGDVREVISDFCAVWCAACERGELTELVSMMNRIGKARARKLRKAGHVL